MAVAAVQLVWFKRDLRTVDHAPLVRAARAGPVLPLYIVEPGLWRQPDAAGRHWAFIRHSLVELDEALGALGQRLVVRVGEAVEVLADLVGRLPIAAVWSHQETGNAWTFARDRRVRTFLRERGIAWHEPPQDGVIRGLADRQGWARRWERFMAEPALPPPDGTRGVPGLDPGTLPATPPGLDPDPASALQPGGRRAGLATLESFLAQRGRTYRRAMSAPGPGAVACSRLSPHLAFGTLSAREVMARVAAARRSLPARALDAAATRAWDASLKSFVSRMHWRSHFMQKLETEPAIERCCFHPAYEGLRRTDPALLAAWCEGRTGFPFLDACMRALRATGWLNFRMRAMLQAVASYQLWLDWRDTGPVLARAFTDYEPGIHWSQVQMQSGTTGINTIRMYNPVKQGLDQDPDGDFTRRWVPELRAVPGALIHEPWRLAPIEQADRGCVLGRDYPAPVVDLAAAAERARERVWAVRRQPGYREIAEGIQARHGSRRSGLPPIGRRPRPEPRRRQLDLGL
jgi:deoxyribodipyrimidine photo-lyase